MPESNSIPIPKNWTFWHVLAWLIPIFVSVVTIAILVLNKTTDLKISTATQEMQSISKKIEKIEGTVDDLSSRIISIEGTVAEMGRNEIIVSERLRKVDEIGTELATINTKLGAHDERLKTVTTNTRTLEKEVAEVDKKVFGSETKSETVENKVDEVSTDVESITTEVDTHGDQLQRIADVVKAGFENNPKVEPLLKHIADNGQQTPSEVVEAIGQIKADHNNDPAQVSGEMSAQLGVDPQTARAVADERLAAHLEPSFYEMIPAAATPLSESEPGAAQKENPFLGIEIKADPRGESIFNFCKKYHPQVATDKCYDYFLQRYSDSGKNKK